MQLRKDYHVEVNEHSALTGCRAFLSVLLAHFMLGNTPARPGNILTVWGLILMGFLNRNFISFLFAKICFFLFQFISNSVCLL